MATSSSLETLHASVLALQEQSHVFGAETEGLIENFVAQMLPILRRQRRTPSPIDRLPPEILIAIFANLRRARDPTHNLITAQRPASLEYHLVFPLVPMDHDSLISATQVCQKWRAAALHAPLLWTDVVAGSPYALLFAQRAKGMPLTVHAEVHGGKSHKRQKKALARLRPHIRSLVLRMEHPAQLSIFSATLRALASALESLAIVITGGESYPDVAPSGFRSAWNFFGGEAGALRSLLIVSQVPLVPTDRCRRLLSFRLHVIGLRSDSVVYLRSLAHFLQHAPDLRALTVFGIYSLYDREVDSRYFVLAPGLRWLSLAGNALTGWLDSIPSNAFRTSHSPTPSPQRIALPRSIMLDTDRKGHEWYICGHCATDPHISVALTWKHVPLAYNSHGRDNPPRDSDPLPVLLRSAKLLRITAERRGPDPRIPSFLDPYMGSIPRTVNDTTIHLETLIIRAVATGNEPVLTQLCEQLAWSRPVACPRLKTLIFSVLVPARALEDLREIFQATTERAVLGYPLEHLILCSPTHAGPDYSVYNTHGVDWVTFSSSDEGASAHSAHHSLSGFGGAERRTRHGSRSSAALVGRTGAEGCSCPRGDSEPPFCAQYDRAWEICAAEGPLAVRL